MPQPRRERAGGPVSSRSYPRQIRTTREEADALPLPAEPEVAVALTGSGDVHNDLQLGGVAGRPQRVVHVGARVRVAVTSLPSARALAEVTRGDDGLAARPAAGLIVLETSTLPIEVKEEARQFLAARGVSLLDCPLSGTGEQARRGDVIAYLSGDETAKATAAPVVAAMTRACHDVGPFGSGSKMKFIANLLVTVHTLAAAEALLLARRAGLDLAAVLEAVGDGAGTSRMFEIRGPLMAEENYPGSSMPTALFGKDIQIITDFAGQLGSPTPLLLPVIPG
jgi:L-threonate 2-dehydrogenase